MSSEQRNATPKRTWRDTLRSLRGLGENQEPAQPEPVIARGSALDVMVIKQFRPAWEIQAYLRFARLPYRVENSSFVGSASTGLYPSLTDGQFIVPADHVPGHVSLRRRNLDRNLTEEEKAEAQAFSLLVREGLQPLLRVMRYRAHEGEVRQTVFPPMKKTLPWPLSMWSPSAEGRRSEGESSVRGFPGLDKDELVARARALYLSLDLRLGDKDAFFFGATPTSLDACVFGHLAEAWTIGVLLDLLPAFENLSRFFRRLCDGYFRPGSFPPSSDGGFTESKAGDGEGVAEDDGSEGNPGSGDSDTLREAMMRADYVNSLNAFNQLPGCALCAEVPYVEDPHPERPITNAGIPPPVLAGVPAGAGAGAAAGDANANSSNTLDDSLPLKYTALSTAVFVILSALFAWE